METARDDNGRRQADGAPSGQRTASSAMSGCRVVTTSESARLLLADQLSALREIDWTVVSGDEYSDPPSHLRTHRIPMRRDLALSDLRSFRRLHRFFRTHRFDFVQTHTPKASLVGLPAARLAGQVTFYTMHGSLVFRGNRLLRNVPAWAFERWCCAWAHRVFAQSEEDVAVLPRWRVCRVDKLTYIGNGIDLSRFEGDPAPPATDRVPTVLMISRLVAEKGVRDFVRVASALRGRAQFVHVGPVEHDQKDAIGPSELAAAQDDAGVRFVGTVADVRPRLAAADLVLLPSYREGIPRVAMEAAAMSRPVAGYDIRGMREVIPRDLGLLVRPRDIEALTRRVRALLDDPAQLPRLGQACHDRVVASFSEQAVVERLMRAYRVAPQRP